MAKQENIRIRCAEGTKQWWEHFSALHDDNEDALRALLGEYRDDVLDREQNRF